MTFWQAAGFKEGLDMHLARMALAAAAALAVAACGFFRRDDGRPIEGNSFAVVGARVFDGEKTVPSATVVVADGRIVSVGDAKPPSGVPVVRGEGKTLLPGLFDAHVHAFDAEGLQDALRFGVMTQLDHFTAWQFFASLKAEREGLARTDRADLFSAGTMVTSPGGHGTQFGLNIPTINGPEEAAAFVKARLAEGSDWIKIAYEPGNTQLTSVSRETLFAVVAAAHAEGALAVVHVSTQDAARDAAAAGADGLVHLFADAPIDAALLAEMKSKGMFVIPTLSIIAAVAEEGVGPKLTADARIAPYLNDGQRSGLVQGFGLPADHPWRKRFNTAIAAANVAKLYAAGIPVLAGTDAPNPGTVYGASLHGELSLLVEAGLTPAEALASATSIPAASFRIPERGRIAPGMRADLVLVEGDPTTDIEATRAISRLFKNGYEVVRRTSAETKTAAPRPDLADGLVSDFEADAGSGFGAPWDITTDQIANGASTAGLSRSSPGANGSAGALRIEGTVSTKFFFPWSGAGVFFSEDLSKAYDLSAYSKISFMARGAARELTFMASTATSRQRPSTRGFKVSEEWAPVEIDFSSIRGAQMDEVYWFAITAGRPEGPFWFEIDEVRLE